VVEPSDYDLHNAGDMAMLEVAVRRLATLWPTSAILVLTDTPAKFPRYRSNVSPLKSAGRHAWLRGHRDLEAAQSFVNTISSAGLVVVAGMGGITDAFSEYARGVLATLELAISRSVPTAMLSQGMGPLEDPSLRERAEIVLRKVDLIALREERAGKPLLQSLGVDLDRVITTGDDALELAYHRHGGTLGNGLGINLRVSAYSAVAPDVVNEVREGVQRSARALGVSMIPLPISRHADEDDAAAIRHLMAGFDDSSDGGSAINSAADVIEEVKHCRVVVTGSYHAGVFALGYGLPVVCLAQSAYYRDKFLGLGDQFKGGCETVILSVPDVAGAIDAAILRAWTSAEKLRPGLLAAAAQQVAASRAAYQRVAALVHR
jgi:colanic acid/amylovoran biosynthesis protein